MEKGRADFDYSPALGSNGWNTSRLARSWSPLYPGDLIRCPNYRISVCYLGDQTEKGRRYPGPTLRSLRKTDAYKKRAHTRLRLYMYVHVQRACVMMTHNHDRCCLIAAVPRRHGISDSGAPGTRATKCGRRPMHELIRCPAAHTGRRRVRAMYCTLWVVWWVCEAPPSLHPYPP